MTDTQVVTITYTDLGGNTISKRLAMRMRNNLTSNIKTKPKVDAHGN
ncbi:hypothetical protein [Marinobacterium iners]|nr:hypothetical protein [Marinobacterium iners]